MANQISLGRDHLSAMAAELVRSQVSVIATDAHTAQSLMSRRNNSSWSLLLSRV